MYNEVSCCKLMATLWFNCLWVNLYSVGSSLTVFVTSWYSRDKVFSRIVSYCWWFSQLIAMMMEVVLLLCCLRSDDWLCACSRKRDWPSPWSLAFIYIFEVWKCIKRISFVMQEHDFEWTELGWVELKQRRVKFCRKLIKCGLSLEALVYIYSCMRLLVN